MSRQARISRSGTSAFCNGCQQSVRQSDDQSIDGLRLHRMVAVPPSQTSKSAPSMSGGLRVCIQSIALLCALSGCANPALRRFDVPIAVSCVQSIPLPVVLFTDADLRAWSATAGDKSKPLAERERAAANFVGALSLDRSGLIRGVAERDSVLAACQVR